MDRGRGEASDFLGIYMNTVHPAIKFTSEWSYHSVNFLDVTVMLNNGILSTDFLALVSQQIRISTSIIPHVTQVPVRREFLTVRH